MSLAQEQFFPELLLLSNSRLQYYSLCQALRQQGCRENKPSKKLDSRDLEKGALGARGFNLWYPGQEKGGGCGTPPIYPTPHLPHLSQQFSRSLHAYSWSPGERGTHYNGLYRKAPPERGTFFRLQVYERVGVSLAELYERVGKFVIFSLKKPIKANKCILWLWKSRKRSSFVVCSRFKERALFYSSLKGYKVLNQVYERGAQLSIEGIRKGNLSC